MKIKHLFVGLLAIAAIAACNREEPEVTPELNLNKTSAPVAADGGEVSFEVKSNVDWTADADQDWVSLDPQTGKGNAKVTATVAPNETEEARTATVTVKADKLTKTLTITQQGKENGDDPTPPEPEKQEYLLVGDALDCGWNPDNGVVLTLTDGYYFAKEVGIQAKKGMHFTKNAAWEGNIKGLHGLIAPDEIGEVGNNDISLTVGGAYDVYLTEALDKFYFMTPGKTPAEAVEHVEIAVSWGVCGAIDGNSWGNSADPEMTLEGEWYVVKEINFTEVNFKIRGNNSWADDVKWGRAAKDQVCKLNEAIAVSTCTEYKEANPDAGDNENIYIGGSGVYDVYFSPEKKEVWVMNPGLKPGDQAPEVEVTYTVTGTIAGTPDNKKANYWNNANEPGLMTLEGDYYVAKGVEFDYDYRFSDDASGEDFVKFKICETGTWNAYGHAEAQVYNKPNTEIPVQMGGQDIYLDRSGVYDVYFDQTNGKVWVMEAGYAPGQEVAKLDGKQWLGEYDGMPVLLDLGIAEPGMLSVALPTMDETGFGLHMVGFYEIEAYDNASGVIYFMQYDWEWDEMGEEFEIAYSGLTPTSVNIVCESIFGVADPVAFTVVDEPYDIIPPTGGESPAGPIADGGYWLVNSGKVMAPLAEDAASGMFPAEDLINYASTVKNTLTFKYDPDFTAYTIQDSYGRYIGQTDWESGNASLTTVLPEGEDYAYYLWVVDNSYDDGTCDVYNLATYFGIGYSAENNNWYLTEDTYQNAALRPFVVSAEFPVEEPEGPQEPAQVVFWENDGSVPAAAWTGSPYRFALEGKDGMNECVATFPADVWEKIKSGPFYAQFQPASDWFQIRILDGWWTVNDESGASDINPQYSGLIDNGDGTYTIEVDLSGNADLLSYLDERHLLFAGDGFIIQKLYFAE